LILLVVAGRGHLISTRAVVRDAPWQIVFFSLGMYLLVYGLRNAGLTDYLVDVLNVFARYGVWGAALGTGFLTALLSSVMNNMPTVLVAALSIDASNADGLVREAMIYANVIGSDLGPKITPIGSLATLLWLHVLARQGNDNHMGVLLQGGHCANRPRTCGDPGSAGTAPESRLMRAERCLRTCMQYWSKEG